MSQCSSLGCPETLLQLLPSYSDASKLVRNLCLSCLGGNSPLQGNFGVLYFGSVDHPGRRKRLLQMAEAVMESGMPCSNAAPTFFSLEVTCFSGHIF